MKFLGRKRQIDTDFLPAEPHLYQLDACIPIISESYPYNLCNL